MIKDGKIAVEGHIKIGESSDVGNLTLPEHELTLAALAIGSGQLARPSPYGYGHEFAEFDDLDNL